MDFVTKGFACFEISKEHPRGVRMGRIYHSREAAEECVKLYSKNSTADKRYEFRSISGIERKE